MNILAIIPARGDSKGIPRKNIRNLANRPLIYYTITSALNSTYALDVYVSSDDDEILYIAQTFGAKVHKRARSLSTDSVTLDPVIHAAYQDIVKSEGKVYDYVLTMQPTSPILKYQTVDRALDHLIKNDIDTLISAKEDVHLSWKKVDGSFLPDYEKRLNRQELEPSYRETGGFVMTRAEFVGPDSRFGKKIDLFLLDNGEEIDIDDLQDWSVCEYYLKKKNILFVVVGNNQYGLGHIYNTLIIANDITEHNISFLVDKESRLGYEKIRSKNFNVFMQESEDIIEDVLALRPDIVINDRLDTTYQYINELKAHDLKVINIEDKGDGALAADMVINAIYSSKEFVRRHFFGYPYYIIRDEFLLTEARKDVNADVKNVLISFGGTDPNNLTLQVVEAIYGYCMDNGIEITIIAGLGYTKYETLTKFPRLKVHRNIPHISYYFLRSDLIFSAMGRTLYEIASLGIPAIIMAQNERELSHTFGYGENGFFNLGLFSELTDAEILDVFVKVQEHELRRQANQLMLKSDLRSGRKRVIRLIKNLIEE